MSTSLASNNTSIFRELSFRNWSYRHLSLALFVGLAAFIALTFRQYGISNDEEVQHTYGRLLLNFYNSGFADQSAFHYKNLYLYGGFFDLVAAGIEKFVPLWVWDMRHLLSALFGFAGIIAAYKITNLVGGERAAFIVVVLLSITGAWSGAMFTHTKDVPFATCMTWALYYTMLMAQHWPKPALGISIKLGVAIGCALGLRIGGVFAVMYLGMVIAAAGFLNQSDWQARIKFWSICIKGLIPAGLVAFALMALFWPWGVMSPSHPLEAAKSFSHFAFDMRTIEDGVVISIGKVSRSYLLEYLLVRLPELSLIGLAALLAVGILQWRKLQSNHTQLIAWVALLIAALFPLLFVFWDKPALYNGVRHFTFILPPLTILAALGLNAACDALKQKPELQLGFVVICIALAINTIVTLVQLHPYQYIYYNTFAGKTNIAESRWEGDYWSSSLREAAEILKSKVPQANQDAKLAANQKPYLVAVCAEAFQGAAYLDKRFEVTENWTKADFFMSSTNMHCDKVLQGEVIGEVKRLNTTLAVVKDRRKLTDEQRIPHAAPQ